MVSRHSTGRTLESHLPTGDADFDAAGALPVDSRTLHRRTQIAITTSNSDKTHCGRAEVLRESRVLVVKGLGSSQVMRGRIMTRRIGIGPLMDHPKSSTYPSGDLIPWRRAIHSNTVCTIQNHLWWFISDIPVGYSSVGSEHARSLKYKASVAQSKNAKSAGGPWASRRMLIGQTLWGDAS